MPTLLTAEIAGLARDIMPNTLRIQSNADSRNTCDIGLRSTSGGSTPQIGQSIVVKWNGVTIFGGSIDSREEIRDDVGSALEWNLSCVDQNQIADRKTVSSSFENQTFQQIVNDLLTNYLAVDGVTAGNIPTGPTLARITFPYISVQECFNELATITGYTWSIGYAKVLDFAPIGTFAAPMSITDSSNNFRRFKVKKSRDQYRNVQLIVGGRDISSSQVESFKGNGTDRTFTVSLPIAKVPTLTVNGGARTVGLKGVDSGFDFYWSQDDPIVEQDAGAAALTSSDTLAVTFQGYFPIVMDFSDANQIAERQAVEGGSGRYEQVEKDESLDSSLLGIDKASGLLRRFAFIPTVVEFEADTHRTANAAASLLAGQTIAITRAIHGIADTFFIQSVTINEVETKFLRATCSCVDGEKMETWADFFAKLIAATKETKFREGTALAATRTITGDQVALTDSPSVVSGAVLDEIGTALVGFSEVVAA